MTYPSLLRNWYTLPLAAALGLSIVSCDNAGSGESKTQADGETAATKVEGVTTIEFEHTFHDFGKSVEGEQLEHDYTFVNTGSVPYVVEKAKGSCDCTTAEWPKEPVPPGGRGVIKAKFDTKERVGVNNKSIVVLGNTKPKAMKLEFHVEVSKP